MEPEITRIRSIDTALALSARREDFEVKGALRYLMDLVKASLKVGDELLYLMKSIDIIWKT